MASALRAAPALMALALAPDPLSGTQQGLDTTLAVRGELRLAVSNRSGSVTVRGGSRSAVRVRADAGAPRVEIDQVGSSLSVRVLHRRFGGDDEADLVVEVPTGSSVEVRTISADVDVSAVNGEADLQSVSGGLTLSGGKGMATMRTVSGDVSATDVRGRLEAQSTSGEVELREVVGEVEATSVSGDVRMRWTDGAVVTAQTVSGEVEFSGPLRAGGRYRLSSHSGDVTARVGENPSATVSVSTFSGEVVSDFPMVVRGAVRRRQLEFTLGEGSARLSLESFSGTIYLRRAGAAGPGREER